MMETAEEILENYKRVRCIFWKGSEPVILKPPPPKPSRPEPILGPPPECIAPMDTELKEAAKGLISHKRAIALETAKKYGVRLSDLMGRRSDRPLLRKEGFIRQVIFWRLYHEANLTLLAVGNMFGVGTPSVMYGVVKINNLVKEHGVEVLNNPKEAILLARGNIKIGGGCGERAAR